MKKKNVAIFGALVGVGAVVTGLVIKTMRELNNRDMFADGFDDDFDFDDDLDDGLCGCSHCYCCGDGCDNDNTSTESELSEITEESVKSQNTESNE